MDLGTTIIHIEVLFVLSFYFYFRLMRGIIKLLNSVLGILLRHKLGVWRSQLDAVIIRTKRWKLIIFHFSWCIELIKPVVCCHAVWAGVECWLAMLLLYLPWLCRCRIFPLCHSQSHSDVCLRHICRQTARVKQASQQAVQNCRLLILIMQKQLSLRHLPSAKNLFANSKQTVLNRHKWYLSCYVN